MTGISLFVLSFGLLPVEVHLARLGWYRVREVHPTAGALIALPSAAAAVLFALVVSLGIFAAATLVGMAYLDVDPGELGTIPVIILFALAGMVLPMVHVAAFTGAGLGLGLLATEIRGTELDDRHGDDDWETLR